MHQILLREFSHDLYYGNACWKKKYITAITAECLLEYVFTSFSHLETFFRQCRIAQDQSDCMESVCELPFSRLAADCQLDFSLDFDWPILTLEYALIHSTVGVVLQYVLGFCPPGS
ncbi:hypothetical protein ILYODFUR_004095 [Ilyodon furcidens]|uniref:Uncharacterized protein n=1 Tax=Ilyodon furcidens TaxID=33524 RepID=A0ABV0U2I6_9TELE